MASIEELKAKIERLKAELRYAKDELLEAQASACGVRVGSIVRDTTRGKQFRVTRIEPGPDGRRPWLKGNQQRNDGSYGTGERHIYGNWELVE